MSSPVLTLKLTSIDHLMTLLSSDYLLTGKAARFLYFLKFKLYSDCLSQNRQKGQIQKQTSSKYLNDIQRLKIAT